MKRITPVFVVNALMIGSAAVLISVELFLAGLRLAGAGALLLGLITALQSWKQQAIISIVHDVRRRVAKVSLSVAAAAAAPLPEPAPVTPPASPDTSTPVAPSTSVDAPEQGNKLRHIGVWTPPKTSFSRAHGRIAASVATDPDAPFRLFAATNGYGSPDVSNVSPRPVALVGSDALAERLSAHFTVQRLHPRLSAAELEHSRPTTFVVEEDYLDGGPWASALAPQGSALLSELRVVQAWMRRNAGINYVLPSSRRTLIAAPALRADTVVVREPLSHDETGPTILIDALLEHSHSGRHP